MFLSSPEFKVGLLVVVVAGLIGTMSLKVAEGPSVLSGSRRHHFVVDDAGGLVKNSAVKMAGIQVGIIEDIELINGKAKVKLLLDSDVPVSETTKVELRADGILGDKHVELIRGEPGGASLPEGSQIIDARDRGSIDRLLNEVGEITDSLSKLADTLNRATQGNGDASTPVGRIILNIETLTKDLAEVSGRNKQKINNIIDRVEAISEAVDGAVAGDGLLARLDRSMKNIEEITEKINRGDGTIGRLINDEETVDNLNKAITNVNEFLGGADDLQVSVDFHSEYLMAADSTKSYLNLRLQPGLDRYYEFGVVDDPRGYSRTVDTVVTEGGTTTDVSETKTYKDKIKFNLIFAKNFYDFTVKGGIIENAGGLGFDYYMFRRKLRFSLEIFDFEDPYLRAFARYQIVQGIYLVGGGDDLASADGQGSGFLGGGIFLTNDDLKLLASKLSF